MSRETVDDPVGSYLLGVIDQKRDTGANSGLDQNVRDTRPVLREHAAYLMQYRRNRRKPSHSGEPLGIIADQSLDGEREFIGGDFRLGPNPPVMKH